jgi:aminoglycoside phosphotransferase (APT) family kinase protein
LRHLRDSGFGGCPEPLGFDEQDREVLSFVEGDGGSIPLRPDTVTDRAMTEQARLIRRFHDASASFSCMTQRWDPLLSDPAGEHEVVCHNDLSIPNTVYRNGRPSAFVDWDFAAPGRRLWDLAYAVWWLVPLHRPEFMEVIGWPPVDQPSRLTLFVDAYELGEERVELLDTVEQRQLRNQSQLRSWVEAGSIPAFDEHDPTVECGRTEYVEQVRPQLESALGL